MNVRVVFFALARDLAGTSETTLELRSGATVADARSAIAERFPNLADLLARSMLAVDEEYADAAAELRPDCEVAVVPPVSGGGS